MKIGILLFQYVLDAGFHRHDDFDTFYETVNFLIFVTIL